MFWHSLHRILVISPGQRGYRGGTRNEDPRGLGRRFPLPGLLLRVELPELFLVLEVQVSELHPDRAIIHLLHRATDSDGPVAEKEGTGGPNNLLICLEPARGVEPPTC